MKKLVVLFILSVISIYLILRSGSKEFVRSDYISDDVLDKGHPLDVNIDVDLLRKLDPAYEQ